MKSLGGSSHGGLGAGCPGSSLMWDSVAVTRMNPPPPPGGTLLPCQERPQEREERVELCRLRLGQVRLHLRVAEVDGLFGLSGA